MKERPILFCSVMVRALLEDRKTQTRRVVKSAPVPWNPELTAWEMTRCPYGQPGDRLWVREAWRTVEGAAELMTPRELNPAYRFWYESDAPHQPGFGRLRQSIHMPRCASRITLEIIAVRVERLQEISGSDCLAEGIDAANAPDYVLGYHEAYRDIFESINGPGSWSKNPWVWVVEFRRLKPS